MDEERNQTGGEPSAKEIENETPAGATAPAETGASAQSATGSAVETGASAQPAAGSAAETGTAAQPATGSAAGEETAEAGTSAGKETTEAGTAAGKETAEAGAAASKETAEAGASAGEETAEVGTSAGKETAEAGTAAPVKTAGADKHAKPAKQQKKPKFWKGFLIGFFASMGILFALLAVTIAILVKVTGRNPQSEEQTMPPSESITEASEPNPENLDYDRIDAKIRLIQKVISENYLFDENTADVEEGVYRGMVDALNDPYTVYYTKEEYEKTTEETSGTYCGIGAVISQDRETGVCTVTQVFPGSPAEDAGMQDGDQLVSVDGHEATGSNLDDFVENYVRGEAGTAIEVVVLRGESQEEITMTITRQAVDLPTVSYEMKEDGIGYLAISMFDVTTASQFKSAVDALQQQGMTKLIIDLRDNPGGVVGSAVEMLDYMLPDGLLVYTAGRNGVGEKYYSSDGHEVNIPTVLLVNGNSASCSEIFAGAYKDFGRATLVGTTTYGKGIVQMIIPLGDGSAIKITTEHYYTPKGFDLQGKGIEPDVSVEDDETYETDPQYDKAVEILTGNTAAETESKAN